MTCAEHVGTDTSRQQDGGRAQHVPSVKCRKGVYEREKKECGTILISSVSKLHVRHVDCINFPHMQNKLGKLIITSSSISNYV